MVFQFKLDNTTYKWGNATQAVTAPKLTNACEGFTGVTTVYDVTFPTAAFTLDDDSYEVCFPVLNDSVVNGTDEKEVWVTDLLKADDFPEKDGEPLKGNVSVADLFNKTKSNGFTAKFKDEGPQSSIGNRSAWCIHGPELKAFFPAAATGAEFKVSVTVIMSDLNMSTADNCSATANTTMSVEFCTPAAKGFMYGEKADQCTFAPSMEFKVDYLPTSFKASDVRTFAFLDQRANSSSAPNFTDAMYYGTEAKLSNGCMYYYGMQLTFPVSFPNLNYTTDNSSNMEVCFHIKSE